MNIKIPNPTKQNKPTPHQRRLMLRDQLWPQVPSNELWNRISSVGFCTIPRTLPLFGRLLDSVTSGKPVSSTYFDLWCRIFDEGFVELEKSKEMAFSSGFTTSRGVSIWHERLSSLENLGFIQLAEGPNGPKSFALIINPYLAAIRLKSSDRKDSVSQNVWNALLARAASIGASDFISAETYLNPPAPPAATK